MDLDKLDSYYLSRLARHYSAISPSVPAQIPSPPFPSPEHLSTAACQQWLVHHLLTPSSTPYRELAEEEGGASWRKSFWRRVLKAVEEGFALRESRGESIGDEEVHPELLEALTTFLANGSLGVGPPKSAVRVYSWGEPLDISAWKSVRLKEDGRMISSGTTGLRTWQASVALANHLLVGSSALPSNILELGAGTGLLSLVVAQILKDARVASARIVASDVDSSVLQQLGLNVALNDLQDIVNVQSLDWGMATTVEGRTTLLATLSDSPPSLILGADIVYDPSLATQLASTLSLLINSESRSSPAPYALLAGTIRNLTTWENFLDACRNELLEITELPLKKAGFYGLVGDEGWEGEGMVKLVRIDRRSSLQTM